MKFASLVFLLVPFVANAADLCVEDNILKCKELGYTESSCPYGGVACQYDTSLWYCAKWTCADGRLYSAENKPTDADCVETAYKNMTCYDCTEYIGCAIGDVFYADGSCSSPEDYDASKTAVGVVYALSANKSGMPYTTAKAESIGFKSPHGRVINLNDLTSDSIYAFNPENPYNNTYNYLYFGLKSTNVTELTNYNSADLMLNAIKNNTSELYTGKQNTYKFATTAPAEAGCTDGTYVQGTANYNIYCAPTTTSAALAFYPPEVSKTHSIVGAGNWYIPAIGELMLLYGVDLSAVTSGTGTSGSVENGGTTIAIVNATLDALSKKGINANKLTEGYYWSSNESGNASVWELDMSKGHRGSYGRQKTNNTRVSLEF